MQRFEIKDTKIQNFEVKIVKRLEIISLYLKYLIKYPKRRDARILLLNLTKGLFIQFKYEEIVLNRLDGAFISEEDFINFLNRMDSIFDLTWDYYDHILQDFETTLALGDFERIMPQKPKVKYFTEEVMKQFLEEIDTLEQKFFNHKV